MDEPLPPDPRRDLETIRLLMERARQYRHPPSSAGLLAGVLALGAGAWTHQTLTARSGAEALAALAAVWGAVFLIALGGTIGLTYRATRREGMAFWSPLAADVVHALWPSLVTGLALTWALARADRLALVPPLWMLCYAAGGFAAGAFARRPVRWLAGAFLLCGLATLAFEPPPGLALAGTFGLLHLAYAALVARRGG